MCSFFFLFRGKGVGGRGGGGAKTWGSRKGIGSLFCF